MTHDDCKSRVASFALRGGSDDGRLGRSGRSVYCRGGADGSRDGRRTNGRDAGTVLIAAVQKSGAKKDNALHDGFDHLTVQGTSTRYDYIVSDHAGQRDTPNILEIGAIHADAVDTVFP